MAGPRILVVEDDPDIQRIVTTVLSKEYEVRTANDGLEGLLAIEQGFKPELVIADIMMPRLDGVAFVKALKGHRDTAKIPVMFLTAKSAPREVIEGINLGARYYLTKPFKVDELLQKVHRLLPPRK
ncbi:MAG: response regulator [Deltaproteobacteria bacterium]|nr:response regulator [Deltaproteobacteria bacterium]